LDYVKADGKDIFTERLAEHSGSFRNVNTLISGDIILVKWEDNILFFKQVSEVRVTVNWLCQ
jgi:hypothetical protein